MNSTIQTMPAGNPANNGNNSGTNALWAAVGALGVSVVALGAGLVYTQTRTPAAAPSPVVATLQPPVTAVPALAQTALPVGAVAHDEVLVDTPRQTVASNRQLAPPAPAPAPRVAQQQKKPAPQPRPQQVVRAAPQPAPAPRVVYRTAEPRPVYRTPQTIPVSAPAPRVCRTCGEVEAVAAVQRPGTPQQGIGVGAVAGGVAGAVLGNQIGKGNGRKLATILGAVGGGYAGHAIEGHMRKVTVYQVRVRMDDGSVRTVEHPTRPAIGTPVIVDGNGGMSTADAAPAYAPPPRSYPQQATTVYTSERT